MTNQQNAVNIDGSRMVFLAVLYFLSGATGLVFQVVWLYRLGLVFGNAAYATAATLAAFFLGISMGGWLLGNASVHFKRPLSVYGMLEIGIAATALLLIPAIGYYEIHYASLVSLVSGNRSLLTLAKFAFSIFILLLPTLLMGGTFPVLAQYVGNGYSKLASRGTILYALNTLGAAVGAFLAGFFLIKAYGVETTYFIAILMASGIGFVAIVLDRLPIQNTKAPSVLSDKKSEKKEYSVTSLATSALSSSQFVLIAFASGLFALSAETLWTRMFTQVLQNSVYSFSAILVVFLIALGFGGILSHILVRSSWPPMRVILILFSLSALLIGFSPVVFNLSTNGLDYLAADSDWIDYLNAVFKLSFIVVFPPTLILGAIFPYLLKVAPAIGELPGRFVGKLVLLNSLGGMVGPILASFFLLETVGLWIGIKIIAILYGIMSLWLTWLFFTNNQRRKWIFVPIAVVLVIISMANPPIVKLDSRQKLLKMWQSSDGVLTVVESDKNIQMRLNNFYVLGDSRSALVEQMQAHIPLLIHPQPRRTLFLGMGTGITAGASLSHDVDEVDVIELVSKVIPAAKNYFAPWINGLFTDKRVSIVSDDARNFLLGTNNRYDVIVGDLFTPWHAGTGSLYTIEHFQQAKEKLNDGGLFAQWLPLYQLTPESFDIILQTFTSVFQQVTLWRADFSSTGASIVLIGQQENAKLSQEVLQQNIVNVIGSESGQKDHMVGLFYLGNALALQDRLLGVVLNTDDKRTIEYKAPVLAQQAGVGKNTFVVNSELEILLSALTTNLPPAQDPYLSDLPANELRYVNVGFLYFRYQQLLSTGNEDEANKVLTKIHTLAPDFLAKQR